MKRSQRKVQPVHGFALSLVPPAIDLQHSSIPTEKGVQQKKQIKNPNVRTVLYQNGSPPNRY
jgi:hypothetical protein